MKKAKYTKMFTVALNQKVYEQIKKFTDEREISIGEWMRGVVDGALILKRENNNKSQMPNKKG